MAESPRSTPTRVGKTGLTKYNVLGQTVHPHACGENDPEISHVGIYAVHPHACGENARLVFAGLPYIGPPPRVWGKHTIYSHSRPDRRSTPTRVGKT